MAGYEVRGKSKQGRNIYSNIDPSVTVEDSSETKEDYRESSDLLSKERLLGLVPKGRNRTIFGPWTVVSTVVICAIIACITGYTVFASKHRCQAQRWNVYSSVGPDIYIPNTNPPPPKSGLNFPQEYPELDIDRSTRVCRNAWHSLTAIPCHELIWTRTWDYGNYDYLESDLNRFLPMICRGDCTDALNEAKNLISRSCSALDRFKLDDYEGRFNTTLLEPNPSAVMGVLVARQTHDCRTSPTGDAERGYCMTDLQERWFILDGLMVEPLHGIDEFLIKTNQYRIEPAKRMPSMTGGTDWLNKYNYLHEERRFGPGRGETSCSYCTLDWLGRKMKSWKPDLVYYEDSLPMELPVYMARLSKAGRRCAGENFTSMWADAIDHYEEQDLLDREEKWLREPSGNKLYLFQHGPSAGDSPLPEIRDCLEEMGDWQSSHPFLSDKEGEELGHYTSCIQDLHEEILSMTCYPFLSIEDLASDILDTHEHFRSSCTNDCKASIQRLRLKTFEACPQLVSNQKNHRTLERGIPFSLHEWRETIFSDSGSLASAEKACGWNQNNQSFDMFFAQLSRQSWITQPKIDSKTLSARLLELGHKYKALATEMRQFTLPAMEHCPEALVEHIRAVKEQTSDLVQDVGCPYDVERSAVCGALFKEEALLSAELLRCQLEKEKATAKAKADAGNGPIGGGRADAKEVEMKNTEL